MTLDDINELNVDPALRDVLRNLHQFGFKRYDSPWVRLEKSATVTLTHGLQGIPHVAMVLQATDSQGTGEAEAVSVTVAKTVTVITVTDTSTTLTRFIRVRAF